MVGYLVKNVMNLIQIVSVKERIIMTKNFNSNTDNNDEWLTPPYIIKELGEFDLDPCSPHP